jgi:hypothetical protein
MLEGPSMWWRKAARVEAGPRKVALKDEQRGGPGDAHLVAPRVCVESSDLPVVVVEAESICSANGQGMGTYDFTSAVAFRGQLALTAQEYAGTYHSTVTTTLSTLAL